MAKNVKVEIKSTELCQVGNCCSAWQVELGRDLNGKECRRFHCCAFHAEQVLEKRPHQKKKSLLF